MKLCSAQHLRRTIFTPFHKGAFLHIGSLYLEKKNRPTLLRRVVFVSFRIADDKELPARCQDDKSS